MPETSAEDLLGQIGVDPLGAHSPAPFDRIGAIGEGGFDLLRLEAVEASMRSVRKAASGFEVLAAVGESVAPMRSRLADRMPSMALVRRR
jgi:hypothetical protein